MTRPELGQSGRYLFVDTSGAFAAGYRRDGNFGRARQILARAAREQRLLVTTTYVVAETHALFLARAGRDAGMGFLRSVESRTFRVVRPSESDEVAARQLIYRCPDKDFSLTDAISFVLMEQLGIRTAFTFDSAFAQYGFATAQP